MTRCTHRTLLVALLASTAACSDDTDPIGPAPVAPKTKVAATQSADTTRDALADALYRVAPTLGSSADADAVRQGLQIIIERGNGRAADRGSLQATEAALDRLERAQPELAAEVDVIRIALQSRDGERMHKPFIAERMHKPFVVTRTQNPVRGDSAGLSTAVLDRMHKPF